MKQNLDMLVFEMELVFDAQAVSGYIHSMMKNASMTVSNMIGPVEEMALANHPIKGFFFAIAGTPEVHT